MSSATDRARQALALFDQWVELAPEQRRQRLDALAAQDPALHAEVVALFAADVHAGVLEHSPATLLAATATAADTDPAFIDRRIGPWRVTGILGSGGMGAVYRGERVEGDFQQQAAIKLIRLGMDHPDLRKRFLRERQILARLRHPNIATLLDGGVADDGAPYFAMELVQGERITAWCDANRLDVRGRVRLFLQVLDAVAFAHRQLIVHRDLKPSNILVDADGKAFLLDFGIAKLIEDDEDNGQTRTSERAFTPEYASPEQLLGEPISTVTDLYQLGVLLYALLAHSHPYGLTGDTPLRARITRMDANPQPLWEAARKSTNADAALRDSTSAQLASQLRGDLSAIAQRCIATDPKQRYDSVDALRADLTAWLDGRAVAAQTPSIGYLARRLLRRHKVASAAAAIAVVALVAGTGVALWQASIANAQARQARLEARRAERVKEFVLTMFRGQDPMTRSGNTARMPAALVEDGIRAANREFAGDPALRGELLDALGEIQANQDDFDGGHATLLQALALRQAQHGADSVEVAQTEYKLGLLAYRIGDNAEAVRRARRVIAIWTARGNAHSPDAARAKRVLALVLVNGKEREQSLPLIDEAVADLSAALGPQAPETVSTRFRHAQVLAELGREDEAIPVLRQVLANIEAARGADALQLALPLAVLADALMQTRRFDESDRMYARAATLARMHFGSRNLRLASTLIKHGELKAQQKDFASAQSLFDQAETAIPEGAQWQQALLLRNRGELHLLRHEAASAESSLRRAFELTRKINGDDDGITWYTASRWGRALAAQGKLQQAETVQRDALAKIERIFPDDYENALLLDALAETLAKAQRFDEAIAVMQRALALTAKKYSQTHAIYRERMDRVQEIQRQAAL